MSLGAGPLFGHYSPTVLPPNTLTYLHSSPSSLCSDPSEAFSDPGPFIFTTFACTYLNNFSLDNLETLTKNVE